jgi:hypothetical protein
METPDISPGDDDRDSTTHLVIGHDCFLCGGAGELADAQCLICWGSGELARLVTLEQFRTMAGISAPAEPRLV